MSATSVAILNDIFANGRVEVGLEVGTDAGLIPAEYIRIPKSMRRRTFAATAEVEPAWGGFANPGAGWVRVEKITVCGDRLHINGIDAAGNDPPVGLHWRVEQISARMVKDFIVVNQGHIRDEVFDDKTKAWVHAVRFWCAVSGLISDSKQREWIEVEAPEAATSDNISNDDADFVINFSTHAVTAIAARGASWRKSNHATGGDQATGFPRRWMQKLGYWPDQGATSRGQGDSAKKLATDAFYVATHAAGVHAILAMMAGSDHNHWAVMEPQWGFIKSFDVKTSTTVRISQPTQVAGAAIVADSMQVLLMMVSEGTSALLRNKAQVSALVNAYKKVQDNGIKIASYSSWFLAGHPFGVTPVAFNQKDASFADLAGELGAVGVSYYEGSTISASLALKNAADQLVSADTREMWVILGRNKKGASNEIILQAWQKIRGGASATMLQNLTSADAAVVTLAVTAYNEELLQIGAAVGLAQGDIQTIAQATGAVAQ